MKAFRALAMLVAGTLLGAAGIDAATESKTKAFLSREEPVEAVRDAVIAQASTIPFVCPGLTLSPAELLIDQPLPRFDADGTMLEGRVRQRFISGGCGNLRLMFNIWVLASPGEKLRAVAAYPGTSGASVSLQGTATPTATVAAGRVIGGCGALEVIDTTDIGPDAPNSPAWREVWLVGGCNMYAQVLLRFIPNRDGTARVDAPADGVRRLQLR